ncbi:MAG: hypothetical protein M3348_16865, partial [Acidobacteriota bacterium]|nr:hypothetical protein [Acidobacteriota bacterium]
MRGHTPAEFKTKRRALKTKCPAFETKCRAALTAFALLLCALAATPAPAQTRAPISKENVVAFLRGLAPERRDAGLQMLAAAMRDSGVDFEVTPAVEQELRDAGATSELVAAARANFRPAGLPLSQTPSASPSSAPQTPAGARGGATTSA